MTDTTPPGTPPADTYPALTIDWRVFESELDDPNLTEVQKQEMIEALWTIIVAFVDLGFGLNPVQNICGKDGPDAPDTATAIGEMVHSSFPMTDGQAAPPENSPETSSSSARREAFKSAASNPTPARR